MAKIKKKKQNPVLVKKYQEGYEEGYEVGIKHGKLQFSTYLENKLNTLYNIEGVGSKTARKIIEHFETDYLKIEN